MGQVDDLFSCLGGHALGYMRAGFNPIRFCEFNPWRRGTLAKHFPGIPIIDNVDQAKGIKARVIVGGPPCQRTSKGAAIHGKRTGESKWGEMHRVITEGQYEWVIVEQPADNQEWEAKVSDDLAGDGWAVEWLSISAKELGYPHIRRRRFAIAHSSLPRLQIARLSIESQIAKYPRASAARGAWLQSMPGTIRMVDGLPRGMDRQRRIEAIGDSNPPEMMTVIFNAIRNPPNE